MPPSVDLTPYIELELMDKDPQDIFDNAIVNLKANFPDWNPREGNMEVMLLETMSLQVAEAIFAINRLPSGITEVLLSMFDITRDPGAPPTTEIRFELGVTAGTTIPAGTSVLLSLGDGLEPIVFRTDSELVVAPGVTTAVATATGDRYTADANGVPAATLLNILDALTYVNYARLNTPVIDGRDAESDLDYLSRGVQRFQRLTTTLVLPSHFEYAALEFPFVKRAKALDNYNSVADTAHDGPVGSDPGYIAVAVYGNNANVGSGDKATLQDYFDAYSLSILTVTVINPTITNVNVTAVIVPEDSALPSDVIDAVELALDDYLDPMTWNWSGIVRRNDLIKVISNVPGVSYVESLTVPATDLTLTGVATLAKAGTLTITADA